MNKTVEKTEKTFAIVYERTLTTEGTIKVKATKKTDALKIAKMRLRDGGDVKVTVKGVYLAEGKDDLYLVNYRRDSKSGPKTMRIKAFNKKEAAAKIKGKIKNGSVSIKANEAISE